MGPNDLVACLDDLLHLHYVQEIHRIAAEKFGEQGSCPLPPLGGGRVDEEQLGLDEETAALLLDVFLDELSQIRVTLLETLNTPTSETPYKLYRAFHTLKGAAGTIGKKTVSEDSLLFERIYHTIHDSGRTQLSELELAGAYVAFALLEAEARDSVDVRDRLRALASLLEEGAGSTETTAPQSPGQSQDDAGAPPADSMLSDEEWELLLEVFRDEAEKKIAELEGLLDQLQAGKDVIYKLFRVTHTLKGSAATVGLSDFGEAAHRLEDYFEKLHQERKRPGLETLGKLYHVTSLMIAYTQGQKVGKELMAAVEEALKVGDEEPISPQEAAPSGEAQHQGEEERLLQEGSRYQVHVGGESLEELMIEAGRLLMRQSVLKKHLREMADALYELRTTRGTLLRFVADERSSMTEEQRMERLFELETELRTATSKLSQLVDRALPLGSGMESDVLRLQDLLLKLRYSNLEILFWRLKRAAKDTAYHLGKDVYIELKGTSVLVDRSILERLSAPLLQIVRNAVVHGIEAPDERRVLGKDPVGRLVLSAETTGSEVLISISDDGRGIDVERIKEVLLEKGLLSQGKLMLLSEDELLDAIFLPGFTTRRDVDRHAGRGVGLDMVRYHIREMGGEVLVSTQKDRGTTFTVRVPITTFIMDVVFLQVGNRTFGIPLQYVHSTFRTPEGRAITPGMRLLHGTESLPVVPLQYFFNTGLPLDGSVKVGAMELSYGHRKFAITFDAIRHIRKVMVFPVSRLLKKTRFVMGSTFDPDGRLVFLLNPSHLSALARPLLSMRMKPPRPKKRPRILVCDDSASVRQAVATILERAGYEPVLATDGQEALEILQEQEIDLLLTDLEMPRMDGFELIQVLKEDLSYRQLPIVVLTSRSGKRNRLKAFELGVQAFLAKPVTPLMLTERISHFVEREEEEVRKIVLFATKNEGKLRELRAMVRDLPLDVWDLSRFEEMPEPVEDGETFEENAVKKALHYARLTGLPTLSDDSGLEVEALGGAPGVYSARWAGEGASDEERIAKLLGELEGVTDRRARFVSVIAFCTDPSTGSVVTVRGELEGEIATEPRGNNGFGYDPVFLLPDGRTLAELTQEEKNRISHRARAFEAIRQHLAEFVLS